MHTHVVCAYRGAPNDAGVFACILAAARNIAFWECLHKIRGIRGFFWLLKDISMTTGLNGYDHDQVQVQDQIVSRRGYFWSSGIKAFRSFVNLSLVFSVV